MASPPSPAGAFRLPPPSGLPAGLEGVDPFSLDMRQLAARLQEAAAAARATSAKGADPAAGAGAQGAAAEAADTNGDAPMAEANGHADGHANGNENSTVNGGAAAGDKSAPAVDVTRHNFEATLPLVRAYLGACDFFSFDCEMTGLFLEGQAENYLDDMQDRYNRTAAAAHQYVITQFGLSCFKRLPEEAAEGAAQEGEARGGEEAKAAEEGATEGQGQGQAPAARYTAATFNFFLFPRPPEGGAASASAPSRRFLCDAGSLAFLASQGFDFNRCIYDGVPFMPVRQRDELMRQLERDFGGNGGGEGAARGPDVVLSKPEDVEFVENLLTSVRSWLAGSEPQLDLPPVNRYLRLLAYQALARPESFGGPPGGAPDWHPGFHVRKMTDDRGWTVVRLIRVASAAEAAALAGEEREAARAALSASAGFAAVWEAVRGCGRPGVGHNCMFDVAYGVAQFGEGRLPATWNGFKSAAAHWFRGGLYDTKHLCRQLPYIGSDTSLGTMFKSLVPQPGGQAPAGADGSPLLPAPLPARVSVAHAPGFEKYVDVAAGRLAHEAGYDAFMTGCVFVALEQLMAGKDTPTRSKPYASVEPYAWRLNVTKSDLPYALLRPAVHGDPSSQEPVPERPLVFHLGALSYGVRANEIHRTCEEAGLGKVRFTFLPGNNALLEVATPEAAEAVAGGALDGRLCAEVLSYADYRARKDAMLAAGTWPLPGYGGAYGSGGGGPRGGGGAGGGGGAARATKRPRVEMEEEGAKAAAAAAQVAAAAAAAQPEGAEAQPATPRAAAKQCTIM